jgi:hypothetical protein
MSDFNDDRSRLEHEAIGARVRRREAARRRARRQRRIALLVAVVALALIAGFVVAPLVRGDEAPGSSGTSGGDASASLALADSPPPGPDSSPAEPSPVESSPDTGDDSASPSPEPSESIAPSPQHTRKPSPSPTPSATATVVPRPAIVRDYVPYGDVRKRQMAAYCRRHYGASRATWVLKPRAVVLHYTAGGSYSSAHNYFASNTPNLGELPGVCAHFIIDKDGRIYQQLPLGVRCRHTIGLNYVAVGIEFVQEGGSGPTWATNQIFNRTKQIRAGLRLVRWLRFKYEIRMRNVLGHGTANASPLFIDRQGWRNDHVDWGAAAVRRFKDRLRAMD